MKLLRKKEVSHRHWLPWTSVIKQYGHQLFSRELKSWWCLNNLRCLPKGRGNLPGGLLLSSFCLEERPKHFSTVAQLIQQGLTDLTDAGHFNMSRLSQDHLYSVNILWERGNPWRNHNSTVLIQQGIHHHSFCEPFSHNRKRLQPSLKCIHPRDGNLILLQRLLNDVQGLLETRHTFTSPVTWFHSNLSSHCSAKMQSLPHELLTNLVLIQIISIFFVNASILHDSRWSDLVGIKKTISVCIVWDVMWVQQSHSNKCWILSC